MQIQSRFWVNNVRLQSQNQPKNETTKLSVVTPHSQASSFFQMIEMTKGIFLNLQGYLGKKFEDFLYVFSPMEIYALTSLFGYWGSPFLGVGLSSELDPPLTCLPIKHRIVKSFVNGSWHKKKPKSAAVVSKQKEIDKKKVWIIWILRPQFDLILHSFFQSSWMFQFDELFKWKFNLKIISQIDLNFHY